MSLLTKRVAARKVAKVYFSICNRLEKGRYRCWKYNLSQAGCLVIPIPGIPLPMLAPPGIMARNSFTDNDLSQLPQVTDLVATLLTYKLRKESIYSYQFTDP
jgi:hypothetical protein